MQHSMAPGASHPAAVPLQHPRRDYGYPQHHHAPYYHQHQPPHSPIQPGYYYAHPPPAAYRWQTPYPQPHAYPPPHMQAQYQPRSPMVVSSAPHAQPMTPVTRQPAQMAVPPQSTQSPRPIPPYMHQQAPAASLSPAPAPSAAPKPEEPRTESRAETPAAQPTRRPSIAQNPLSLPPEHKTPFWPKLPWYSVPEDQQTFPSRAPTRRRRRRNLRASNNAVALPTREEPSAEDEPQPESQAASAEKPPSESSTIAAPSEPETPATSQAPSESDFTQVSTPATPAQAPTTSPKPTPTQQQHARRDTRTAIAVPNIPGLPKPKEASPPATVKQDTPKKSEEEKAPKIEDEKAPTSEEEQSTKVEAEQTAAAEPAPVTAPRSWADLVRSKPKPGAPAAPANGEVITNGALVPKTASLAEALKQYDVRGEVKLPFLEPRGLVNTGNMCYMNSVLQVLVFCVPFYNFLDQVRQRTIQSMKSDTPLVDAMIMFMREFKVLASAESADGLRSSLKQEQLEEYGDSVTPEYVYDVIRKLPRFASMRRGQQQDAEEFLGFLLEGLHDECVKVMQGQADEKPQGNGVASPETVMSPTSADGWQEVGPKQKAAVTRTAGQNENPSPITKIFGGYMRSEFRVPGLKDSVTLEPFKPLQLDIGSTQVNNIVDALKGITKTEVMTGEFGGRSNTAKKQVFIDSLPPVLILHLKRFQYDNSFTGTQKIWKKVGYPLELEVPKEVLPPGKRNTVGFKSQPKYRLTSVVYHHGKSAAGGHYTVDVLRQDSREWIRMDDTVIRRVRAEDVAEGGAEEDPKILAKALEQHKADSELQKQRNMYQGLDEAEKEPEEEKPWSEVNGNTNGHSKKWSGAAITTNGTSTPTSTTGKRTPTAKKEGVRDSKVAYILLYEQIRD